MATLRRPAVGLIVFVLCAHCAPRQYYEADYPWTDRSLQEADRPRLAAATGT